MTTTTPDLVPLDGALKKHFQKLFAAGKQSIIVLAKEAYSIHCQRYHRTERKYDKEFETWWKTQGMDRVFGNRVNWTKWYRAGEAIEKVRIAHREHLDRLPLNRDALCEIAMLQPDELQLALENNYTRTSITQSEAAWKRPRMQRPVINPGATASAIRRWRKNWREPRRPRSEKCTLPFITIRLHSSLLDFDKFGRPSGVIAPGQAVEINHKIVDLLKPLDPFIRVDSKLEHILRSYDKRKIGAEKRVRKSQKKK
jgi:hypothetical protein